MDVSRSNESLASYPHSVQGRRNNVPPRPDPGCLRPREDRSCVLCQLAPHLLPVAHCRIPRSNVAFKNGLGDMPIEVGGTLLSYRPASRPGDDIVIWSLIFDPLKPSYDAEQFWRSRIGSYVATGFLLSSAARLRSKGLSWAPATPFAAPKLHGKSQSSKFYRAFNVVETEVARITEVCIFST